MTEHNLTSSDRRVDILNSINVRLSLLEDARREAQKNADNHSDSIRELNQCFNDLSTNLKLGLQNFNSKFDSMITQFKIAFIIVCTGCTVFVFLFGAFIAFNNDLDTKFLHQDHNKQTEVVKELH
jgi:hypothetical protein